MPTALENYFFTELPRRIVAATSVATGSSFTESWVLVATGDGFQTVPADPATLGFEPEITQGTAGQYYRGDKTWADLNAAAVGAIAASEKGQPLGVATLDADGFVHLSQMNPAVIERVVVVADEAARYALTTAQVQNGDVVNQQSPAPSSMWYVVDQTNLDNASGYLPFSSGVAASVAWSGITGKPAIVGDLENISLTSEGDLIQYVGGTWVNVSIATLKASLALEIADINLLQDDLDGKQSQSDVLDNLSSISTTGLIVRNSDGLFIGRELVGIDGITVTEPQGTIDNPTLSLTETGVTEGTYGDEFNYPVVEIDKFGRNISVTTQAITRNPIQIQDVPSTTLQANTEHILGNGVSTYTSNMSLDLPDNVPGGTWVKIKCGEDFEQVQGSVAIVAPVGKTVQGDPSFPFSSYFKLYPFGTVDMVYSSSTSNWTVLTNATSFLSSLHVARQGATNGPSNSHLIRSSATSPRTLDIPDRDVDLSSVGQTDFLDANFRISDDGDPSKKVAFSVGAITAGETRVITVPDSNVDLGLVPTNLAYNSATAVLTQTLTDNTSLSADLSAIAVNQVALTGASPTTVVTVTGTQASTKYFLAGNTSLLLTFDVTEFTNTGKFIEIVNNTGGYRTITINATGRNFRDEANDLVTSPVILVRGESLVVFPVNATTLQVYRNKPDVRNIKNNSNTVISGFKTTNLFVDSSFSITGSISSNADEILRIFALTNATINFGYPVYDARTDTQISTDSYTLYAGQVLEVTKTSATKWVVLGGHIQDTSRFRLYNSSNVPTKFDTSAATAECTITMPNADVDLGNVAQAASASSNGYLTSTDWSTFNGKQTTLVSGTNIKTINGTSVLGSGDLVVGEQSVVLLEQDGLQTLSVGKRHYLPRIANAYTLNLNAPTGAAIGDWFILESRYSASLDGIGLSAFLLGINLKMAAGEYVIGYGDIVSPDAIPLLNAHNNSTNSPNFTNGCSFRFTKVTATAWVLQPTYGAVMPERFIMKVGGTNFGGTLFVSTAAAGTYAEVTLPPKDANLGDLSFVATTNSNNLSGTNCHILGGNNNTVSGTNCHILGGNNNTVSGTNNIAIGCSDNTNISGSGRVVAISAKRLTVAYLTPNSLVLGTSTYDIDVFNAKPFAAAVKVQTALCSRIGTASGYVVLSITSDGENPTSTNCLPALLLSNTFMSARHEFDFIITFGEDGTDITSRTCFAKRTVYVARRVTSVIPLNAFPVLEMSVATPQPDVTLGLGSNTVTIDFTLDAAGNRLIPTVVAISSPTYQAMQVSCRVDSHYNRK